MKSKALKKLIKLGLTQKEIYKATGISPRTQRRIKANPRHKVSNLTKKKIDSLESNYDKFKYKRKKESVPIKKISNYHVFNAKIGQKKFYEYNEEFPFPDILDDFAIETKFGDHEKFSKQIDTFIENIPFNTRFINIVISALDENGDSLFGMSSNNIDTSGPEGKKVLKMFIFDLMEKFDLTIYGGNLSSYAKSGELNDEEKQEKIESIEKVQISAIGILKGI